MIQRNQLLFGRTLKQFGWWWTIPIGIIGSSSIAAGLLFVLGHFNLQGRIAEAVFVSDWDYRRFPGRPTDAAWARAFTSVAGLVGAFVGLLVGSDELYEAALKTVCRLGVWGSIGTVAAGALAGTFFLDPLVKRLFEKFGAGKDRNVGLGPDLSELPFLVSLKIVQRIALGCFVLPLAVFVEHCIGEAISPHMNNAFGLASFSIAMVLGLTTFYCYASLEKKKQISDQTEREVSYAFAVFLFPLYIYLLGLIYINNYELQPHNAGQLLYGVAGCGVASYFSGYCIGGLPVGIAGSVTTPRLLRRKMWRFTAVFFLYAMLLTAIWLLAGQYWPPLSSQPRWFILWTYGCWLISLWASPFRSLMDSTADEFALILELPTESNARTAGKIATRIMGSIAPVDRRLYFREKYNQASYFLLPPMNLAEDDDTRGKLLQSCALIPTPCTENGKTRIGFENAVKAYCHALNDFVHERQTNDLIASKPAIAGLLGGLFERSSSFNHLLFREIIADSEQAKEIPRESAPVHWALRQSDFAIALGEVGRDRKRQDLGEAIAAYRNALQVRTRVRVPLDWAATNNNLGNALSGLGQLENSAARLREAIAAFDEALKELTLDRLPVQWAAVKTNLGNALMVLSDVEASEPCLHQAISTYREAMEGLPRKLALDHRAAVLWNLGNALRKLGERSDNPIHLREALAAYRQSLREGRDGRFRWDPDMEHVGETLELLSEREHGTDSLEKALSIYNEVLAAGFLYMEQEHRIKDRLAHEKAAIAQRRKNAK